MITPDNPDNAEGAKRSTVGETCVPVKSLSVDGTAPAAGDETEVTAQVRVTRIEGDKAYIELASVNGEPVTDMDEGDSTDDDMMAAAKKADDEMDA